MRTSLAVALPTGAQPLRPTVLNNGTVRTVIGSSIPLPPDGTTVSVVIALADNLQQSNTYDPAPKAQALAQGGKADEVAHAASEFWSTYWERSSISLPQSPEVERYWFGAQYGVATMTASSRMMELTNGRAPPSGLYGPWVTTDSPAWCVAICAEEL